MTERHVLPPETTLWAARLWLLDRLESGEMSICPCCGQDAKVYERKLNSGMAASLIVFLKTTLRKNPIDGWLKIPDDFDVLSLRIVQTNREYNKLHYWGLLESFGRVSTDTSKTPFTGTWRITALGTQFARGEVSVPKHVYLYNGQQVPPLRNRTENPLISVREALADGFDYDELMKG